MSNKINVLVYDNGKYIIHHSDNGSKTTALRYNEEWRDLTGDNLISCLINDVLEKNVLIDNYIENLKEIEETLKQCNDILKEVTNEKEN